MGLTVMGGTETEAVRQDLPQHLMPITCSPHWMVWPVDQIMYPVARKLRRRLFTREYLRWGEVGVIKRTLSFPIVLALR